MSKCSKCIFYDSNGYYDMGCSIPECKLRMVEEQRKKNNNEKYNLFNSLIRYESLAEKCPYFTSVSESVDLIKNIKKI